MAKSDEILAEIRSINVKLYGEGNFEGDIPDIKSHLAKINGHLDDHSHRITTIEAKQKVSKKAVTGYLAGIGALIAAIWKSYVA